MKRTICAVLAFICGSIISPVGECNNILIELESQSGVVRDADGPVPIVSHRLTNETFEAGESVPPWRYSIVFSDGVVVAPLVIGLGGNVDARTRRSFRSLAVDAVYYHQNETMTVHALLGDVDNSAKRVRELREIDTATLSEPSLQKYFQEARYIAEERMAKAGQASVFDVQAVYKLIELAYRASQATIINPAEPDGILMRAIEWLEAQNNSNRSVVSRALAGFPPVEKILEDGRKIEGIKYNNLWSNIMDESCAARVPKIEQYREMIQSIPYHMRRRNVIAVSGVSYEVMQSEINSCTTEIAASEFVPIAQQVELLRRQFEASKVYSKRAESLGNVAMKERLASDAKYFESLAGNKASAMRRID